MGAAISIRLPEPLARRLNDLSETTERPKSYHVQKALENYFEEFADLRIALDRLHNPKDTAVSSKVMRASLGF
jgi:RHH-type rel operon transcriptional repressor/antitoxin RelB